MADELDAPLGQKKRRRGEFVRLSFLRRLPLTRILYGILALVIVGLAAQIILVENPEGGKPTSSVSISSSRNSNPVANKVSSDPISVISTNPGQSVTDLSNGASITTIGDDVPDATSGSSYGVAALSEFGVLADLVEETQNGPIPQMGPQGDTPFDAYARASITPQTADGRALIAIIVTGLGLSEGGTLDAIEKLPDNITLAFAPYGRTLKRTAAVARAGGHELMLEIPLEPFDYPDNDPGPQTLLTGQPPRANLDRLFWLLARFGGYTGVINHMGARFTASSADFGPIMEELGLRGLGYVDDGTSNRSLAANLALNNRVPFGNGDVQIDTNPSRSAILTALQALEAKAEQEGSAVGIASALPVSIQTISDWAKDLEERNILLVPVSAIMTRPSN